MIYEETERDSFDDQLNARSSRLDSGARYDSGLGNGSSLALTSCSFSSMTLRLFDQN